MRRDLSFLFLLSAVCVGLMAQIAPSLADKRVALVIGNSNYKNTPTLANPDNDATDVAQALSSIGFQVTLKLDAEKRQMDQAVVQFAREASTADAALFYYAGHGMQYQGRNYVMPVDAELQDEISLRYEMTAIDDVKAALERSSGVKIMVLDACRNNPLAAKLVRSISVHTRDVPDVPNVQGYARPEKTRGMIIVYATQADDVANDGDGRNSPFSTAFLKEIREPGLEIGTMFRRIGGDVYQATNGQQSPELSISLVPEYYLNQAETDQSIWARIRASVDANTIREFLDRYPNSFYAPDARARLDLLDRQDASAADAARLKAEQAERERIAEEARAYEQELAAKLAAAETERQKLTSELAQREAAQAAAEARQRADLQKAEQDRQQREAEMRAEIEREKATASQLEKDRLVREALDRDRSQQAASEQAAADRDRAARENAEQVLQSESARARALKAEIVKLEQQADQAKADALAEAQKAADAKKAANSADAKAALATPTTASVRGAVLTPRADVATAPLACKRDEERLAKLRAGPSMEQAEQLARELACEDLRPQVQRLMESLDAEPVAAAQSRPLASAPQFREVGETQINALPRPVDRLAPGQTVAPSLDNAQVCKRDGKELVRIRANPDRESALRFARALECDDLRAQVARLLESVGN
jgi:uncharacterized caspase-like protein